MSTPTASPLRELVQDRLGRTTLAEWVGARRAENASWVTIAADLSKRTDLEINRETLRRWMAAESTGPTEAAA